MKILKDGETTTMKGSAELPYILKRVGDVYSCSCPAWLHQSEVPEKRTCKHLRKLRGDDVEDARLGIMKTTVRVGDLKKPVEPGPRPDQPFMPWGLKKEITKTTKFFTKSFGRFGGKPVDLLEALKTIPANVPLESVKIVAQRNYGTMTIKLCTIETSPNPKYEAAKEKFAKETASYRKKLSEWKSRKEAWDAYEVHRTKFKDLIAVQEKLKTAERSAKTIGKMRTKLQELAKKYSVEV